MTARALPLLFALGLLVPLVASCRAAKHDASLTLYTCASANVEQAVVSGFEKAHAGTKVTVFRAATGQLNARVAADERSGGIRADVIWACDPLTMHGYDTQGLLRSWSPPNAAEIPAAYRTPHFVGIDLLYMAVVAHTGGKVPTSWADLATRDYRGTVAIPSPSFAASALGLLGYLAATPGYGMDFYQQLKRNGAVQLSAPADTLTGVEQGKYRAGVTLANAAYTAQRQGSPITVIWPQPGAVAIYAPIGVTTRKELSPIAMQFADYAASRSAQVIMAKQDTYVTMPGIAGPPIPQGSPIAAPDWPSLFGSYKSVLAQYVAIFGS